MATIRVKSRSRPDIGKQRERERDEARKRERRMCSEKITIPKDICSGGKWISRPLRCVHRGNFYWFSVRLDSQRSSHTHTSPSPLSPILLLHLLLPSIVFSRLEVLSPSVRRYLGRNSFLHRCPYLARPTPDLLFLLPLLFSISAATSFLSSGDARFARVEDRSKTRTMNIK